MQSFLTGTAFILTCIVLFLLGYAILLVYDKIFKN